MNKLRYINLLFVLVCFATANAQLVTSPLGSNGEQQRVKSLSGIFKDSRAFGDTLELPFIEDFSYLWPRPDQTKWLDHQVFINADFPVNPPSWGVATFDGLDQDGNAYASTSVHGGADTLTSRPINLTFPPSDSLYLSFFYQPKGIGNFPEFVDSFLLEFKAPGDSVWQWIWSTKGEDYPQTTRAFKPVLIPIKDTAYLHNGFQFRFRNYAQQNGSWDHWHLDYIWLDKNRNKGDSTFADVAFMHRASSLLKDYQSVPLRHFLPQAVENMDETYSLSLTNNSPGTTNKLYAYEFFNDDISASPVDFLNAEPQGPIGFRQRYEFTDPVKYTYEDPGPGFSWTKFSLVHYLTENSDEIPRNDTTVYEQVLSNYYALDDGTAEERINMNSNGGGYVAQRFNTYLTDTLVSVQYYFNKADDGPADQPFHLMIWSGGPNVPGAILLRQENVLYPQYEAQNKYYTYVLDQPLVLPAGTYYFGWEQTSNFSINLGFDKNFNNNDRIFYNQTGTWNNFSAGQGTMMIRPLFRQIFDPYVSVNDDILKAGIVDFNLFPNPSDGAFTLQRTSGSLSNVIISDLSGRTLFQQTWSDTQLHLNTGSFSDGIYLVTVTDTKSGLRSVKRLAVRH